jgi:hypothetical protein
MTGNDAKALIRYRVGQTLVNRISTYITQNA